MDTILHFIFLIWEFAEEHYWLSLSVLLVLFFVIDRLTPSYKRKLEKRKSEFDIDILDGISSGNKSKNGGDIEFKGSAPETAIEEHGSEHYRVWYGTDREPYFSDSSLIGFTNQHADNVTYGYCDVHIPKSHKIGSIGSSWLKRIVVGDDRLKLNRLDQLGEIEFWNAVVKELAQLELDKRHALVFIHGYRNSFEDAAIRAAQMGTDLGIKGGMAFFSWPSRGETAKYAADEATIQASEKAITQFLIDFATKSGAAQVHVVAHSMGNRGFMRSVDAIAKKAEAGSKVKFGQFILAAPDISVRVFKDFASQYQKISERTTLYLSSKDLAIKLSEFIHDVDRLGLAPPFSVYDDIDTVYVSDVVQSIIGHGYFAENEDILKDIHSLLNHNTDPEDRFKMSLKQNSNGQKYWSLKA